MEVIQLRMVPVLLRLVRLVPIPVEEEVVHIRVVRLVIRGPEVPAS